MYLSSEYLKQFDKDLYYKILLLESFEDQAWHTAAQLAQVVQLDARSVSKYLNELSKNYQQFSGKTHPLFTKITVLVITFMIRSIQLNMSVFDLSRAKYAEIPVAARHF